MAWSGIKRALQEDPRGVEAVLNVDLPVTSSRVQKLPTPEDELAWVIERESGWRPDATNPGSNATGLIQFMPSTATMLGTTVDALRRMSRTQQASYIERYFQRVSQGHSVADRVGDLYLLTFMPGFVMQPDDAVIAAPGSPIARANPGLADNDGYITAGGVRRAGTPPEPRPWRHGRGSGAGWGLILFALALLDQGTRRR